MAILKGLSESARHAAVYELSNELTAEELARIFNHHINCRPFVLLTRALTANASKTHRTLQSYITLVCAEMVYHMSTELNGGTDGRNESSVKLAKRMAAGLNDDDKSWFNTRRDAIIKERDSLKGA